jgi:nucleotide-binding universal stress UspA family protein
MYKDILLPVELSHEGSWHKALEVSLEFCQAFGSRLHIISVLPEYGSPMVASFFPEGFEEKHRQEVDKQLHAFVSQHVPKECAVQVIVAEGKIHKEIINAAETIGADLIVMGTHKHELLDYVLGPNAERVVSHSNKSVLVVRG